MYRKATVIATKWLALLAVLLGALCGAWAVSLDDPAEVRIAEGQKLCGQAEKLLAENKPGKALALYQEVLRFLPTSPRAKAGVEKCRTALQGEGAELSGAKRGPKTTLRGTWICQVKNAELTSLSFSPDGETLAVSGKLSQHNSHLWLLDARTLQLRQQADFSQQSDRLMAKWHERYTPSKLKPGEVAPPLWNFNPGGMGIPCVVYRPDGRELMTGSGQLLGVWQPTSLEAERVIGITDPHSKRPNASIAEQLRTLSFSADGGTLAVGGWRVLILDGITGALRHQLEEKGTERTCSLSRDGRILASASDFGLNLWELSATAAPRLLQQINEPDPPKNHWPYLDPEYDHSYASERRPVPGYRRVSPRIVNGVLLRHVSLSPDGNRVAWTERDGSVSVWQVNPWRKLWTHPGEGPGVTALAYHPSGHFLSVTVNENVVMLKAKDGRILAVEKDVPRETTTLQLLDADDGQTLAVVKDAPWDTRALIFSPDGSALAVAGAEEVKVWSILLN